jgi:hypothetical protein
VSDERPNLVPVTPKMSGRGLPLPPRLLIVSMIVALVAFAVGLQVNPTRIVTLPAPTAAPPSIALGSTPPATPALIDVPVVPPTQPVGIYHVTQRMANEIAIASQFYAAYNSGQLAVVMSLLSAQPRLVDCNYTTHAPLTVAGRSAIATYLRARFADHDHWTVEFYNEDPANDRVIAVVPLLRESDLLLRLGASGGIKRSFPVDFYLAFSPDGLHIELVAWSTMPGDVTILCSP